MENVTTKTELLRIGKNPDDKWNPDRTGLLGRGDLNNLVLPPSGAIFEHHEKQSSEFLA